MSTNLEHSSSVSDIFEITFSHDVTGSRSFIKMSVYPPFGLFLDVKFFFSFLLLVFLDGRGYSGGSAAQG
jgi:hypothetical protein